MAYSKRIHFELQYDEAETAWVVTGPTQHVNARDALRAAGGIEAALTTHPSANPRWTFATLGGGDAIPLALLCASLNAKLRDTVWRKPDSAAGRKRTRAALRAPAALVDSD